MTLQTVLAGGDAVYARRGGGGPAALPYAPLPTATLWSDLSALPGVDGDYAVLLDADGAELTIAEHLAGRWMPGDCRWDTPGASLAWGGLTVHAGAPTWDEDGIQLDPGEAASVELWAALALNLTPDHCAMLVASQCETSYGAVFAFIAGLRSNPTNLLAAVQNEGGGGIAWGPLGGPYSTSTSARLPLPSPKNVRLGANYHADPNGTWIGGYMQQQAGLQAPFDAAAFGAMSSSRLTGTTGPAWACTGAGAHLTVRRTSIRLVPSL